MTNRLYHDLRLYVFGAWFSYRALHAWVRPLDYLSVKVAYPLFQILLFVLIGRYAGIVNEQYIVIGNLLVLTAASSVLGVTMTVGNERNFRTLPYLIGSPAPRVPLFLGRVLFNVIDGFFTVLMAIGIAALLLGLDLSQANFLLLLFCVLLMSLTSSGLGLILGSISLVTREGWNIAANVNSALLLLCGVNFPAAMLPPGLQAIAYALPLTRGIAATRLVLAGADWSTIAPLVGGEVLIGMIYGFIGYMLLQRIEKWSLVTGQLEAV
jgi:ABC-2 type transport system permease protein